MLYGSRLSDFLSLSERHFRKLSLSRRYNRQRRNSKDRRSRDNHINRGYTRTQTAFELLYQRHKTARKGSKSFYKRHEDCVYAQVAF